MKSTVNMYLVQAERTRYYRVCTSVREIERLRKECPFEILPLSEITGSKKRIRKLVGAFCYRYGMFRVRGKWFEFDYSVDEVIVAFESIVNELEKKNRCKFEEDRCFFS